MMMTECALVNHAFRTSLSGADVLAAGGSGSLSKGLLLQQTWPQQQQLLAVLAGWVAPERCVLHAAGASHSEPLSGSDSSASGSSSRRCGSPSSSATRSMTCSACP